MINFDLRIDNFNEHTARQLEMEIKQNQKAQKEMRKNLYCCWFPNTQNIISIVKLALHDIDLTCDKIISKVTLNNSANKVMQTERAFEKMEKSLSPFQIRFDKEYKELKIEEVNLQYQLLWAKKIAKDLEADQREIIKQEEKEERQLLKDKEKAEKELAHLEYEYAQRVQAQRDKQSIDEINKQIKKVKEKLHLIDYNLQRTRAGFVYVVSNNDMKDGFYKIGITRRSIEDRMKELSGAGHAFEMNVHGYVFTDDVFDVETKMHQYFNKDRVNKTRVKKEWFKTTLKEIEDAFLDTCGLIVHLKDVEDEEYTYAHNVDRRI